MLQFSSTRQWVAISLAFQSQAWHTDDTTGHTSPDTPHPGPGPQPGPGEPDHAIRIVGALVNPIGPAPEHETITILNASPSAMDLAGWQIADKLKNKHGLCRARSTPERRWSSRCRPVCSSVTRGE